MTINFKESSPKRFQTNRSNGRVAVLAWTGARITEVFSGAGKKIPVGHACLNNPKLFFNHSLENWQGPSAGGSCSAPEPFNEIR